MKKQRIFYIPALLFLVLCVSIWILGCSPEGTKTSTSTSTSVTSTSTTSVVTPGGNLTASQLSNAGKSIFATDCASCHGTNGQGITGPALIGQYQSLDKYQTAQGLMDFIDTAMPLNAPGSLTSQQYLEVLSFILLQNSWVSDSTIINPDNLSSIALK